MTTTLKAKKVSKQITQETSLRPNLREFILLRNSLVEGPVSKNKTKSINTSLLGTLFSNLAYYGYVLSKEAVDRLLTVNSKEDLGNWWNKLEPALKDITGDSKNMGEFVVYKNFPKEVLDMPLGEYWFNQILMYWGFPNDLFTTAAEPRDKLFENVELKVLHLAKENSLQEIYNNLLKSPARWTNEQFEFVCYLTKVERLDLDVSVIPFKENLIKLVSQLINTNSNLKMRSAMDVLRLAWGLSDGDITFATNTRLRKFNCSERRFLLRLLENTSNLEEDVARDKERWKRLFYALGPSQFGKKFERCVKVYDLLYNNNAKSFNSRVETLIANGDTDVIKLLQTRPGDFVRRLHHLINVFGRPAATGFLKVVPKLKVIQLLKLQKYFETINKRACLTVAPKGNWTKLQILPNTKKLEPGIQRLLLKRIKQEIGNRVSKKLKKSVNLQESADLVKLQTNDSSVLPYGRGTVFPIPDHINFIRSASYWQCQRNRNIWFDNGWNFFGDGWINMGSCCWSSTSFGNNAAIFSGDPTNSKTADGKACQMIDLYIDRLLDYGVRYAVWNILCYSRIKFKDAEDVFAAFQWGEDAQKGKLFEPSRAQLVFPIEGDTFAKYIVYIDLKERKVVYIDANLKASVASAICNGDKLSTTMPAFVEYLDTLPSVYDLFEGCRLGKKGIFVGFDDKNTTIRTKRAYVFKPVNENNKFEQLQLSQFLD